MRPCRVVAQFGFGLAFSKTNVFETPADGSILKKWAAAGDEKTKLARDFGIVVHRSIGTYKTVDKFVDIPTLFV